VCVIWVGIGVGSSGSYGVCFNAFKRVVYGCVPECIGMYIKTRGIITSNK